MAVAGVERASRGRNRPFWNGYQRDENTEKPADWIKSHHGPCFSPNRAQPPTSLPAQSDTITAESSKPAAKAGHGKLMNRIFFGIATAIQKDEMQRGSLIRSARKHGPDVWQFRWSETGGNGRRAYRKRVIGTVDQYSDAVEARQFAAGILAMPSSGDLPTKSASMTIAELSKHFQHRDLAHDDSWRSYSTRRNYTFYLERWIIPRWGNFALGQVRTVEVELWLRSLPLARSSCAKVRNLMSVLFNHAWRYELFDRNPIKLVSSKRQETGRSKRAHPR
jgi:hypothetical protein